jgi:hypothetical protein
MKTVSIWFLPFRYLILEYFLVWYFFFHFIIYIKLKISNIVINICYYSRHGLGLCLNLQTIYLKENTYEMKIMSEMIRNYKYQCNVLLLQLHERPPSNTPSPFNNLLTLSVTRELRTYRRFCQCTGGTTLQALYN